MYRRWLAVALVAGSMVLAGCVGGPEGGSTTSPPGMADIQTTTAPPTTSTTTVTTTWPTTTSTPDPCTESGDWVALSEVDEAEVNGTPADERVTFENLSQPQQEVVTEALERDCAIHQRVFQFGEEHPSVLVYDDEYYLIYVGVRTATTTVD